MIRGKKKKVKGGSRKPAPAPQKKKRSSKPAPVEKKRRKDPEKVSRKEPEKKKRRQATSEEKPAQSQSGAQAIIDGINENLDAIFEEHLNTLFDDWEALMRKKNASVKEAIPIVKRIKERLEAALADLD